MTFAFLAQAASPGASGFLSFLPFILILLVVYFLMLRPQMKKQKEHTKMINALGSGDDVVTAGGLHGRIIRTNDRDQTVLVQIARGVVVTLERGSISRRKSPLSSEAAPVTTHQDEKKLEQEVEAANKEIWNSSANPSGRIISGAQSQLESKSGVSDISGEDSGSRRDRHRRPRRRRPYFHKPTDSSTKPESSEN